MKAAAAGSPHSIFDLTARVLRLGVGISSLKDYSGTFTGGKLVPYKMLAGLPMMEQMKVGVGGHTIQLPHESNGLLFLTTLESNGGYIGPHFHRDCVEQVHVIRGAVYEAYSETELCAGDTHRVPPGQVHYYISRNGGAEMLVEIYQPSVRAVLREMLRLWGMFWSNVLRKPKSRNTFAVSK